MSKKNKQKAIAPKIVENSFIEIPRLENTMSEAFGFGGPGIGGGINPGGFGFAGTGSALQPVSDAATSFENLRWYLISNFRQLISQLFVEIGLVRTICCVPVDDGLRGGVMFKTKQLDEQQVKDLQLAMDRDGDLTTAGWAGKWTRAYGGGGILILVDDQDPEDELDIDAIDENTKVVFRAVDMWELFWDKQNVEGYDAEIQREDFEHYNYYSRQVHKSRVLPLKGDEAPSFIRPRLRGWGVSVIEVLIRSMNQYLKATDLGFEVLDEFKLDVYKIKNLMNTLMSPGGTVAIKTRVQMANWQKDYQNAVVLDSEDEFDHKQLSFSGLGEAMAGIRMQVASDMRMPILKLFGQSVSSGGLGTSSVEEMENYNSMVEAEVRNKLKYHILKMAEIKCKQLFGMIPDDLELEFKPLRELSAVDQETVKTQKFTRLIQAKAAGEVTTQEFRDAANKGNLFDVQLDTAEDGLNPDDPEIEDLLAGERPGDEEDGDPDQQGADSPDSEKTKLDKSTPKVKAVKNAVMRAFSILLNASDEWEESKHPRADDGKFGKGGSGKKAGKDKGKKDKPAVDSPLNTETLKRDKLVSMADMRGFLAESKETFEKIKTVKPDLNNAVFEWSRAGYQYARKIQKGEKVSGEEKKIGQKIVDDFNSSFGDLPSFEGPLVRDLQLDIDDALGMFKAGESFELDAHSSFTAAESYGRRKVRMIVEKSTKGKSVWGLCQEPQEAEVIVAKGQKYKIDRVEESDEIPYVRIYLSEVNE